jgi:hypothetical protein
MTKSHLDEASLDHENTQVQALNKLLAAAYPTPAEARTLAEHAGLGPDLQPQVEGNMRQKWKALMDALAAARKLRRLVEIASIDPAKEGFRDRFLAVLNDDGPDQEDIPLHVEESISEATRLYLIEGKGSKNYRTYERLRVYDDSGTVALLIVTKADPDSPHAQAILCVPEKNLLSLKVDNNTDNLSNSSNSKLVPITDKAVGYISEKGYVQLRQKHRVNKNARLRMLRPQIDEDKLSYQETSTFLHVAEVLPEDGRAVVKLVDGNWPEIGTLVMYELPAIDWRWWLKWLALTVLVGLVLQIVVFGATYWLVELAPNWIYRLVRPVIDSALDKIQLLSWLGWVIVGSIVMVYMWPLRKAR